MPTRTATDDFWEIPPLSNEDQDLVNAYREVGVPLDQLPYTDSYDRLVEMLGMPNTNDQKFLLFQRLLRLRKQGRLIRLRTTKSESL
jgi:hypothetical protein